MPALSIIIVSYNTCDLLARCLAGLPAAAGPLPYEAVVVDNASADGSAAMVRARFPAARLIANAGNPGFAAACNQGLAAAHPTAGYLVLLNSDAFPEPGALADLAGFLDRTPAAGAAGPRLLQPDGAPQPYAWGGDPTPAYLFRRAISQRLFRRHLHDWGSDAVRRVDWVSGACVMVRRPAAAAAGPLDEGMFMYFEDNDWCRRMRSAGWEVWHYPPARVVHVGGASLARDPAAPSEYYRSLRYFYAKHYGRLAGALLAPLLLVYRRGVR